MNHGQISNTMIAIGHAVSGGGRRPSSYGINVSPRSIYNSPGKPSSIKLTIIRLAANSVIPAKTHVQDCEAGGGFSANVIYEIS
jgi:hypothetical protein